MHETIGFFFLQILQYLAENVSKCLGKVKNYKSPSEIRTHNLKIRG